MRPKRTPTVRATFGSRSGPITTSATMPINSISEKPTSNMVRGAGGSSALLLFLDLALDGRALRGSDLAGGLRGLVGLHPLLESLHRAAEVGADVAQLLRAEDEQHDHEHDQPMPDTERTHRDLLVVRAAFRGPRAASSGRTARDRRGCVCANDTRPAARSARCSRWSGSPPGTLARARAGP